MCPNFQWKWIRQNIWKHLDEGRSILSKRCRYYYAIEFHSLYFRYINVSYHACQLISVDLWEAYFVRRVRRSTRIMSRRNTMRDSYINEIYLASAWDNYVIKRTTCKAYLELFIISNVCIRVNTRGIVSRCKSLWFHFADMKPMKTNDNLTRDYR